MYIDPLIGLEGLVWQMQLKKKPKLRFDSSQVKQM